MPIIKDTATEDLAKFTVGLVAITTLLVVLDRIPMNDKGSMARLMNLIPGFVAMGAVVLATAGFFKVLSWVLDIVKQVEWNELGKFIAGITVVGTLIGAIALLGMPLALLGPAIGPALLGVVAAIVAVGAVVLAVVGLSYLLEKIVGSTGDTLLRGLDILVEVGAGIGRFVGAIAGGIAGGVLEGIGYSLAAFAQSLSGFDPASLQGIKGTCRGNSYYYRRCYSRWSC